MKIRLDRLKAQKPLPLATLIQNAGNGLNNKKDSNAGWQFISLLQKAVSESLMLYVPIHTAQSSALDSIDPLDLNIYLLPEKDLFCKVELEEGGTAYCAFLDEPEEDFTPVSEYRKISAAELFRSAYEDKECRGVILEPWRLSALLNHQLLELILNIDGESATSSLFLNLGVPSVQDADVIVNFAKEPFKEIEAAAKDIFKRSGDYLRKICKELSAPKPGEIVVSPAGIGTTSVIFHAALPEVISRTTLKKLIDDVMDRASYMGYSSIAMPSLGNEIAKIETKVPFALIAVSGWLYQHPACQMDVTITAKYKTTFNLFCEYLYDDQEKEDPDKELLK